MTPIQEGGMPPIQIVSLAGNIVFLIIVLYAVYKGKLREAYALVWLLTCIVMIAFSACEPLLTYMAILLEVQTPAFALLSCLIMGILLLLFQITVVISEHNRKISRLTQEITLLREKLDQKQ